VTDEIRLTLPAQEDFRHVAHLVVGGVENNEVRATVGPFDAAALAKLDEASTGLAPRRIVETVCDSVSVRERNGASWIDVTKQVPA